MLKRVNRSLLLIGLFFVAQLAVASGVQQSGLSVTNAFFYVPLGTSKESMAFFTLTNNTNTDIRVTGVKSTAAQQVVLMPEPTLLVPAHQSVALKASGRYLKINGLKNRLTTGDELHLVLSLSNGRNMVVVALAKSAYDQTHGH